MKCAKRIFFIFSLVFILLIFPHQGLAQDRIPPVLEKIFHSFQMNLPVESIGLEIQQLIDQAFWNIYGSALGISICRDLFKADAQRIALDGSSESMARTIARGCATSAIEKHPWVGNAAKQSSWRKEKIKISFLPKTSNLSGYYSVLQNELKVYLPIDLSKYKNGSIPKSLKDLWWKEILTVFSYYFFGIFLDKKADIFWVKNNASDIDLLSTKNSEGYMDTHLSKLSYEQMYEMFQETTLRTIVGHIRAEKIANETVSSILPSAISSISTDKNDCDTIELQYNLFFPIMVMEILTNKQLRQKMERSVKFFASELDNNIVLLALEDLRVLFRTREIEWKDSSKEIIELFTPGSVLAKNLPEIQNIFMNIISGRKIGDQWKKVIVSLPGERSNSSILESFCDFVRTPYLERRDHFPLYSVRPVP